MRWMKEHGAFMVACSLQGVYELDVAEHKLTVPNGYKKGSPIGLPFMIQDAVS